MTVPKIGTIIATVVTLQAQFTIIRLIMQGGVGMSEEKKKPDTTVGDGEFIEYNEVTSIVRKLETLLDSDDPQVVIDAAKELHWWIEATIGVGPGDTNQVEIIKETIKEKPAAEYPWWASILMVILSSAALTLAIVRLLI